MRKTLLLMALLSAMLSLPAQDKVTVKFTAKDQNGKYCPFTEVEVTNVTRNWTATLHYPDTVLTLTPTGVGEYGATACRLGNAFPNPFTGETRVPLELSEAAEVLLRVVRVDGTEMASRALRLDAGTHHVDVRLASPGLSFLIVTTPKGSQVAKLVSESGSGHNAIEVKAVASRDTKSGSYDATGDFVLGDMMKYVGKATFESAPVASAEVTQAQSADATVVLVFPVTIPDTPVTPVTPTWPDGTLPGKFSVSATQQVQFSQGNLQYTKSTGEWSFMDHQYDIVIDGVENVGEDYANYDVITLFGWGTSGCNIGNTYYQPWNTDNSSNDLYGPVGEYNLTGTYANADWGVWNPISNGGNVTGMWRTLTKDEWVYVFDTRSTASGIRFARAKVNDVNGVIILPDDWDGSYYSLNNANLSDADFSSNMISLSDWETSLEAYGAVFLPAAGYRGGTSVYYVGSYGSYWSASYGNEDYAYNVYFYDSYLSPQGYGYRYSGRSVRLVRFEPTVPTVTTADVTDIAETTATAGGEVTDNGGANVTERGVCWSTSANPTTADDHHAVSLFGMSFFNVSITGLTANTTYHVRAYATNSEGTAYGEDKTFTTLPEIPVTPTWPDGTLPGYFSVSAGQQVQFSQGNLQYIGSASTPYWKFADSQLDYLGQNGQSSSDPNIDRDLFGFGTSGYNHGAVCYQPWSTSNTYSDYYVYGDYTYNLFDQTGQADWGYNAISNGGNAENLWRTLTREEWNYVFNERSTSSGLRYAKATIDEVKGIILFPDDWNSAVLNPTNANSADANFETQLTVADWTSIYEPQGAVFLPAAGYRDGNVILGYGFYQSSSSGGQYNSCNVFFDSWRCNPSGTNRRERGFSVRLVCPAH